jgi:hypothetical protein
MDPISSHVNIILQGDEKMTQNIRKRDGTMESLKRGKIERSIRDAGASSKISKDIANSIEVKGGMSTNEIRKAVSMKLSSLDPKAAETYDKQRRLSIHQSNDLSAGKILLDNTTLTDLQLKPGDQLSVVLSTIKTFEVGHSEKSELGAFINNDDIKSLKFNEGQKIIVRRT